MNTRNRDVKDPRRRSFLGAADGAPESNRSERRTPMTKRRQTIPNTNIPTTKKNAKSWPLPRVSQGHAARRGSLPRTRWAAVMREAQKLFVPGNRWGVVAYGIRPRRRRGQRDGTLGLVAYVERKRARAVDPVPSLTVTISGRVATIVPDVIGTGQSPQPAWTDTASFTGIHVGAALQVDSDSPELGSIGCVVALDPDRAPTHLVTAGHLFDGGRVDEISVSCAANSDEEPIRIGTLVSNLLDAGDRRRAGGDVPRDVALVELNDEGRALALATRSPFSIEGVRAGAAAASRSGQVFSWMSGDFSPEGTIVELPMVVHFDGPPRGAYTVTDVLALEPRVTDPGNSGSALLSVGDRRWAFGICVGGFRMESIFEPLDRALKVFESSFGRLVPWNNPKSRGSR